MKQNFVAIILGGTGQVGGAAVTELLAIPECREVVMVTRKPIAARARVRNVVLDTGAADFAERTAALAREVLSQGPVSAVSCVGVGSGSRRWSEEELQRLELGVVGAFARGCHNAGIAQFCLLSAAGSRARSRFRYARVMGMKEDTVRSIGFTRLAIFRPGIIVGNAHTPAWATWLGSLVPGPFGNIDQRILARSIAAEIALHSREAGEVTRENAAMKKLVAQFSKRETSMANNPNTQSNEEAGSSSTSASSSSSPPPVAIPEAVWPGMTLNWDSPSREILLHAELPFWLLVADCSLPVTVSDCTLELSITRSAIEIQRGDGYRDSHSNTALIEKAEGKPSDRAAAILGTKQRFTLRMTRTLISIKTNVLEDALAAIQEGGRRSVDAQMYFTSFVHAHLPFVNKTINAYRRAGADPFTAEVTEWDIPVWYIDVDENFIPIQLVPYKAVDSSPANVSLTTGESSAITFVEASDIEEVLNSPELPGEIDLLDAWSLYYRGRQSDAIRSLVTSLEVLLEAKLREYLSKLGLTDAEVESRLDVSWNNFQARLAEYTRVSRRRVPGPILSVIPYINGVRLNEELEQARRLRHKIVHEGERISYPFHGQMQRVMETMTWLFNWLAEYPPRRGRRLEGDPLKSSMRGVLSLPYEYTPAGVVVQRRPAVESAVFVEDELRQQLVAAIEKGSADIEKFALMAVSQVGFRMINTPPPEPTSPFFLERSILIYGDDRVPLFLHDSHESLGADIVERIAARVLTLKVEGKAFSLALLIVNSQNGLEWRLRDIAEAVSETAAQMAVACGIAILTTVDLLLLIKGVEARLWSFPGVSRSLMQPGRVGVEPPGFHYVGFVRKFFDRPQVASVDLDPSATIRCGDFVVIRLADRYYGQEIESIQRDGVNIDEAHGCRVGIQTALRRSDVGVGDYVFVRAGRGISSKESVANMINEGCPNYD